MEQQQLTATLAPADYAELSVADAKRWKQICSQQIVMGILIFSDILLAFLIWEVAVVLHTTIWGMERGPLTGIAIASVPIVLMWVGLRVLLGLYPGYGLDQVEELRRHTYSVFATIAITAVYAVAFQHGDLLSRLLLIFGFLGLLLLAPLWRHLVKQGMNKVGLWGKPVVIMGSRAPGAHITKLLRQKWELGYNPVAVFDYGLAWVEGPLDDLPREEKTEQTLADIANLTRKQGVNTIVFAMPHAPSDQVDKFTDWASISFRHVVVIPNLEWVKNAAVIARDLGGTFGIEIRHNLLDPWVQLIKRSLDLVGVVAGSLLISPLLIAFVILIKLDSPGPAFFGHYRLGAGNKHFRCWKFRTMHLDAEHLLDLYLQKNPHLQDEWNQSHKLRNDPRVTRVGRFLRRTSLDELPQLWNVFVGEMSLIGPRPIVAAEVPKYGKVYELYKRVRPGMSGFWQVSGRSDTDYRERVAMDSYYVRN